MIYLSNLKPKELRIHLALRSVYEPYEYKPNRYVTKYSKLLTSKHKGLHIYELQIILFSLFKHMRSYSSGFCISLDRNKISKYNKTLKKKISYDKLSETLRTLDKLGYIFLAIGSKDVSYSTVSPSQTLYDFIDTNDLIQEVFKPKSSDLIKIEVEDSNKTIVEKIMVKGELNKKKYKVFKSTQGMSGMREKRNFLLKWNLLLDQTKINLKSHGYCKVIYNMKFVDDLEHGGRMYCGYFQSLPSDLRKDILLNGNPTVELDFKSCHPRIIACLENYPLESDFDPYTVIDSRTDNPYSRHIMKLVSMACLYSAGEAYAVLAVEDKLRKFGVDVSGAKGMIEDFIKTNPYLKNHLYQKDQYKDLQYIDSEIARRVIKMLIDQDIPVLSYHDSFRVEVDKREHLLQAMVSGYIGALSDYMIKNGIEFDNITLFENCQISLDDEVYRKKYGENPEYFSYADFKATDFWSSLDHSIDDLSYEELENHINNELVIGL